MKTATNAQFESNHNKALVLMKSLKKRDKQKTCNLCKSSYFARSKFDRFCSDCKQHNELYLFHEWLPVF